MIIWRIRGKIIRIVLCCVVYDICAQWYAHTHTDRQFLQVRVGLGLGLVFVHLFLGLVFCMFFCFSLDYFVLALFAFVVLGLVSSVLCQEVGWEDVSKMTYVVWNEM